jgi:FAD binding domain
VKYGVRGKALGNNITSGDSSDRGIAHNFTVLSKYSASNCFSDLTGFPYPCLMLSRSTQPRPSCPQSRSIATRIPSKVKKESASTESTPLPVPSRETPLYLIYFGVSIWAALVGYGAHFYFSSSQGDSGPRTIRSSPSRKDSTSGLMNAISDLHLTFPDADRVLTDAETLKTYGSPKYTTYIGSKDVHPHGVVVFPQSTEDVVVIVNIARKWGVPIVPFGGGTSLEGHTGGVSSPYTPYGLA